MDTPYKDNNAVQSFKNVSEKNRWEEVNDT